MAPPDGPKSLPLIPPEPLVCMPGDRPDFVPYVEGEGCNVETARETYQRAVDSFTRSCSDPRNHICDSFMGKMGWQIPSGCQSYFSYCNAHQSSIPMNLHLLGGDAVRHPFVDIVYHLDHYGIDDFRSAGVFNQVAEDTAVQALARKGRSLTLLYPASGSHMTPFLIPLKLIDQGAIDRARVIYTEINELTVARVDEYLRFFAFSAQPLFQDYRRGVKNFSTGYEVHHRFKYKGKPIEFVFAIKRSGELYARDEYIREADLVVFHDGVYNDADKPPSEGIANRFFERLKGLASGPGAKLRLILAENQWGCRREATECSIEEIAYPIRHFPGFYSCHAAHFTDRPWYTVERGMIAGRELYLEERTTGPKDTLRRKVVHAGTWMFEEPRFWAFLFSIPPR